jgi:hypothetical protein
MITPSGLSEIISTFGDISKYIGSDGHVSPRWESEILGSADLAFPIRLSWDMRITVTKISCHKLLVPVIQGIFSQMVIKGLSVQIKTFGGCYAYRPQRTGTKLSTHAWGIAIDLNPESNEQGTMGNMHPGIIKLFRDAGFEWGGDWPQSRCDPMHFQFATDY